VSPTGVVTPLVTGIDTTGLAFGPNGNLYAANISGNQVYDLYFPGFSFKYLARPF
jgi:hypothetical protein